MTAARRSSCNAGGISRIAVVRPPSVEAITLHVLGRTDAAFNFTILFPLGLSSDSAVNEAVAKEHQRSGDMLQADFLDTYRNLTLKTYAHSHYMSLNCTNVRVVMKIDDDIAWNVRVIFDYISKISQEENALHCRMAQFLSADRNISSKWYTTEEEYPEKYFPQYCHGPLYVATHSTIRRMHVQTNNVPLFWIDDVFSTGFVAREALVSFKNLSINVYPDNPTPFLRGDVVGQYTNSQEQMTELFLATNFNISAL
ncbi:hypothetical protein Y032_0096g2932 [Ancylostoma ceylanicum]|uniref:Hexosyltransferase n=1 Tax=Ancylostoma ceylanicum TaxID=53326 RepID=A0A016TK63_9BILA|nr:hypothetical protein Y032_0096g2932 [Ancylostoma ceylanicum]